MIKIIKWFEKNNKISWIITILIAIIIFYISSLTFEGISKERQINLTILYHFFAFAGLCFFLNISLIKGKKQNKKFILTAIILSIIYAISDEIHQLFIPTRNGSFSDVLIDSLGIICSGIFYSLRLKIK